MSFHQKEYGAYLNVLLGLQIDLLLSDKYYFDQVSIKPTRLLLMKEGRGLTKFYSLAFIMRKMDQYLLYF